MTVANHDEGLLTLAVKRGHCSEECAQRLRAQRRGRSMSLVLAEDAGLAPEAIRALRDEQKRNSIPGRIGPYRLTEHLGNGGMSIVFKALDSDTHQVVAVKLLSPRIAAHGVSVPRFHRETRSAREVDHPRVIKCLDHGEVNQHPYQILEYMAGGDAAALLMRSGGRLPPAQALTLARDSAEGLAAIHAAGMMHRDIKPSNIFIDAEGRAKIADLGLARHVDDEDHLTIPGHCIGTPLYMSPEQARGVSDIDGRTDVYSLGATLYHFITGCPPFSGASPRAVITAVITEPVPDPRMLVPELDAAIAELITRSLAKERSERPQNAAQFAAEIDALLNPSANVVPVTPSAPSWTSRIIEYAVRTWRRLILLGRHRHARYPR